MEGVKQRIVQGQKLLAQVKQKRQEVKTQAAQTKASTAKKSYSSDTVGWDRGANSTQYNRSADPLEAEFQKWEIDEELERIKRNMK